jgi:NAD kinase
MALQNTPPKAAGAPPPTRRAIDKIVVVTKKTPLEELVQRLNSPGQARFYLEQNGVSFADYEAADRQYHQALGTIQAALPRDMKHQIVDRDFLPTFQFGEHDLVVTVGPDGLVVNTAKYLTTQPILAINPDPARVAGILLPFGVPDLGPVIARVREGSARIRRLAMAQVTLNDGQVLYGVNDLFIGAKSHISARYRLQLGKREAQHSSSGIIVSTGVGSTGWLRSVTAGAWEIARHFAGAALPADAWQIQMDWEANRLWYSVREPFPSPVSQLDLVFGAIEAGEELIITSQMPENGVIFSDGIEADYLAFNSGAIARVGLADRQAHLIVAG